jgi:taspase, threonine aspartase, 1
MAEINSVGDSAPFVPSGPSESAFEELRQSRKRRGGDVVAVFVHAGAGFHSIQNENIHLAVCSEYVHTSIFIYALSASLDALLTHHISAAKIGMRFLKAGSTAVEAVEAAIRVLEDNEITNAGYGSNLSVDGHVECDASIVDQYGRSGAVGAMGRE